MPLELAVYSFVLRANMERTYVWESIPAHRSRPGRRRSFDRARLLSIPYHWDNIRGGIPLHRGQKNLAVDVVVDGEARISGVVISVGSCAVNKNKVVARPIPMKHVHKDDRNRCPFLSMRRGIRRILLFLLRYVSPVKPLRADSGFKYDGEDPKELWT